jgi:hypothetical protein
LGGRATHILRKLKGRGAAELRERGRQALAARAERRGLSPQSREPSTASLRRLLDASRFASLPAADAPEFAAQLLAHFRERTAPRFFAALDSREETAAELRRRWPASTAELIARAERVAAGRFDLLGLRDLDFGSPPDWHLEPVAGVRAPRAHWSLIDYLDPRVAGDKKITWELNRHQYFVTLGQAYWLTDDARYAEVFAAHLSHWLDENPPKIGVNWASSLEVAFRAVSWLWALRLFGSAPQLTPALFLRALKSLYLHGCHVETYLSTHFSPNTHLTGEALGLYHLGTLLPELGRTAARWRERGRAILVEQLPRHVRPDGTYFEQASYYARYTADFYTHFLLLERANGETVPPAVAERLQALLDHLMHLTRPDGTTPLYGDDDGGSFLPLAVRPADDFRATLATAACLFARADYKFVAGPEAAEESLWLCGPQALRDFDALAARPPAETSRAFRDGGFYVMRDSWSRDANFMLADAGPHGALSHGHSHADALSFDLAARGRTLLVDPGTYTYTGDAAERDRFRSTAAHNALTVDGQPSSVPAGPFSWQTVARARTRSWLAHARFDYLSAEHDGYERLAPPVRCSRSLLFVKGGYWIARDRVESAGAHDYGLHFQFAPGAQPAIQNDGANVVRQDGDEGAGLSLFAFGAGGDDGGGAWRAGEGWVSRCYGAKERAASLAFRERARGASEFFTFMLPHRAGESARANVRELNATGGRLFEIAGHRADCYDLLLASAGVYVESGRLASDFEWAWARFSRDGATLEELLLLAGRRFSLYGRELVRLPNRAAYAYARRDGDALLVETAAGRRSVDLSDLYAAAGGS